MTQEDESSGTRVVRSRNDSINKPGGLVLEADDRPKKIDDMAAHVVAKIDKWMQRISAQCSNADTAKSSASNTSPPGLLIESLRDLTTLVPEDSSSCVIHRRGRVPFPANNENLSWLSLEYMRTRQSQEAPSTPHSTSQRMPSIHLH